jgi:hypothetical protein
MKLRLLVVLALVASCVILSSPPAAFADPDKEAELLKRIEQLEKRVEELEKIVKERPPGKEPARDTEKKLVGNWTITDADKKTAADKKMFRWTDLNMKADGTCALVGSDPGVFGSITGAKYKVTVIGSVTQVEISWGNQPKLTWGGRIASVTEKELVLEYGLKENTWVKVRYTRVK